MQLAIHIIDAFTAQRFQGNQAAVVPLQSWLPDATLQAMAAENNLSETAYVVWNPAHGAYAIRWFSPLREIDFCGHATLATAYVLLQADPTRQRVNFWATAVGHVHAMRLDNGHIEMTFPRRDATRRHAAAYAARCIGGRFNARACRVLGQLPSLYGSLRH